MSKNIIKIFFIKLVKFYQKIAPSKLRESCRFTPSCSEYMILSIEKFGVLKGINNGVNRLLRCKVPNGGIDYPPKYKLTIGGQNDRI